MLSNDVRLWFPANDSQWLFRKPEAVYHLGDITKKSLEACLFFFTLVEGRVLCRIWFISGFATGPIYLKLMFLYPDDVKAIHGQQP